ncbi:acyl-CoA dehydrogenase family protein [Nocardia fluminea]|uniref:acyl-CoA dehydrogenase family protein n=1 Tax=Nocardia fluminea TaxID=134984 RepID=UPI003789AE50
MNNDELIDTIGDIVKDVNARWGRDYYLERARNDEAPTEMYKAMADAGLWAVGIPEDIGGSGGGLVATAAVMEHLSRVGTPPMLYALTSFARQSILRNGTPEQIQQCVVPTLSGERMISFAVTEPDAGTNSFAMRTAVKPVDGGFVLNGQKTFISGADQSDVMLVAAKTDGNNISMFIVPTDTPGITMQPLNINWHAPERQFSVWFDNVALPAEALLGAQGHGSSGMFDSMNAERVVVAAWALGLGYHALERAVAYAKERAPWGAPIGSYQAVAHPLAKARAHLDAARGMVYRAATEFDAGRKAGAEANMAKYLASEAAGAAIDAAMQTHGGSAFDADTDVITLWPMIRLLRIAPVNNEMILNYVAERVLGLPRSY